MANPMPPPSSIMPADAISVTKNPVKENLSPPHSEFKDPPLAATTAGTSYDCLPTSSATRVTSKTIQHRFVKTQRSEVSDGLETGSDSDVVEDTANTYASRPKYLSSTNRLYDSHRLHDRGGLDYDQISKTRPVHVTKDSKYTVTPLKPNVSPIQPVNEDVSGRDNANQRDLLANYETPFLSEFTRRLSSRSLINTSSTLPSLKSKNDN